MNTPLNPQLLPHPNDETNTQTQSQTQPHSHHNTTISPNPPTYTDIFKTTKQSGKQTQKYKQTKQLIHTLNPNFTTQWEQFETTITNQWEKLAPNACLYLQTPTENSHYIKTLLDALFNKNNFLNEIIWVNKKGKKQEKNWHNTYTKILVYTKNKHDYIYNTDNIDREEYMAPTLVTKEKAEKGKLPTDTWWQKYVDSEEKLLTRIITASTNENDIILTPYDYAQTNKIAKKLNRQAAETID